MNDDEFLRQLQEAFAIEAEEHLQAIGTGLLALEKAAGPERQELVERIFREAHSLKGASAAANRGDVETVCQALESVFALWKRDSASIRTSTFDVLNGALNFLGTLQTQPGTGSGAVHDWAQQLLALTHPAATPAPAPPVSPPSSVGTVPPVPSPKVETVRVPIQKMDHLLVQAEEMVRMKLVAAEHTAEIRELGSGLDEWRKEWGKVQAAGAATSGGRLRDFMDWSGQHFTSLEKRVGALAKMAERNERSVGVMVDGMLEDAKRLAMQPFARLLESFPRQVRHLSREQGKEVELTIQGSEVEIDKRILEEMKDPLTHLIRNAIDHGLEMPEERRQRGKPAAGALTIAVSQREGNAVELLVADDGGGLDGAKLKAAAVRLELLTEAEAGALSEAATEALIFESGLSTSPILTEISGRGLGMAIVREKVEKLGGQIAVETKPRAGTSWRILLPVTLATFRGILVQAGGQTLVLPTVGVERIKRVGRGQIVTVESRETITVDGRPIALAWLADVLELPRAELPASQRFVETLVLGSGEQRIAFAVDSVVNEQEVLVKKLSRPLVRVRNVTGATILGSGLPAVILNASDLIKSAIHLAASGRRGLLASAAEPEVKQVPEILVADDSVTSRMLLKNILESAGYRVATAVDGLEGLTTLKSRHFDLVVSDVEMPRMDGFELTTRVRADATLASLPVVLVTALGTREHRERGIDVGANAYIVKSDFDQSNLLEIVRKLL